MYDKVFDLGNIIFSLHGMRDHALSLLKPFSPELMDGYDVSKLVNNPRNDSPACVVPAGYDGSAYVTLVSSLFLEFQPREASWLHRPTSFRFPLACAPALPLLTAFPDAP